MALPAAMIVTFPFGGRLSDTFGRRLPTTVRLALLALGIAPMAVTGADVADLPVLVISVVFVGIGVGLAAPGLQTAVVESVRQGGGWSRVGRLFHQPLPGRYNDVSHTRRASGR